MAMKRKRRATARQSDPRPDTRDKRRHWLLPTLLIVLATCASYAPVVRCGYIWDDDAYITRNPLIQQPDGLWQIWFTLQTPQYYPLVFTSFWIEHNLWQLAPAGYHVVNVLLHLAGALLVWRLARRLGIPWAWFIGAVFAIHPVQVESVAWIAERKNVLSGVCYLLTLLAYLRFDDTRRWRWYALAGACFLAALLSKTVTAMLAPTLPLILFYRRGRLTKRHVLGVVPFLIVGAAFGLMTAQLEREKVGAEGVEWGQTFVERALIIAPSAFAFYAGKIAWPHPLIFNYPRWVIDNGGWLLYLPLIGVLLAAGLAVAASRRLGWGPLLLGLFAAFNLFPALGFLNVYPHRYSYVADHFQYIASLGFIILYVSMARAAIGRLVPEAKRKVASTAGAAAVLAVLGILTFRQCFVYENGAALWEKTLAANPNSWIAMTNLGNEYVKLKPPRVADAEKLYRRALEYPIAHSETYGALGNLYLGLRRNAEAVEMYRNSLKALPDKPRAYSNLGLALGRLGRLDEALAASQKAVDLAPHEAGLWFNLATLQAQAQQFDQAAQAARRAVELNPEWSAPRLLLAHALTESGSYHDAWRVSQEALRRFQSDPRVLLSVTWLLATCPDDSIRDGARALQLARAAERRMSRNARLCDTLAAALAELGDFQQAVQQATEAVRLAEKSGQSELARRIARRLEGYRAGQPYRHSPR